MSISRRSVLLGMTSFALAGCVTQNQATVQTAASNVYRPDPYYVAMYGPITTEPWPIAGVDVSKIDPRLLRQEVAYSTPEKPGTIVVDPGARFLYLVRENGKALRYGVGVGREAAFNFVGEASIERKAEWPRWTPTKDMIAREPERYGPYADGMDGGPDNPLGPRALYLYQNGRDTLYRIHGTTQPHTIGTQVSSGCIRLFNQDIIDLYRRVPLGTKVVVLPASPNASQNVS
ncbi:L,D-transpeptidase [Amorphus orientalis]|uniref:Lipoprotein-anchoring transpeptidase ErfK/SrfK n=1 Tax=Amorphus orientalis TaxID=649198 RepID=A0AAE3VQF7_9HYPH|nr:L,D-transpeptidase [Amorphus orientalis]MDQ0316068.1 lipoprotein-anchoring transpeptidase ErfK/SrfK [Amorphus orientalis]